MRINPVSIRELFRSVIFTFLMIRKQPISIVSIFLDSLKTVQYAFFSEDFLANCLNKLCFENINVEISRSNEIYHHWVNPHLENNVQVEEIKKYFDLFLSNCLIWRLDPNWNVIYYNTQTFKINSKRIWYIYFSSPCVMTTIDFFHIATTLEVHNSVIGVH